MDDMKLLQGLKYWLKPKERLFEDFKRYTLGDVITRRIFIDRNASVLFVAHLDTVQESKFIRCQKTKGKKIKRIYAQGLDDRLGAMLAFELSKELNVDLLLTDYEESGRTTIKYHELKDYNWIVEFDRAGLDVVTYDLSCAEFDNAIQEYWPKGFGSYSDICEAKTDVCCFNLGVGYELAHSKDSYCVVDAIQKQVKLFRQFYNKYCDMQFKQNERLKYGNEYNDFGNDSYWSNESDCCDICGMQGAELVYNWLVCQDCFERMMYEQIGDKEHLKWFI